MMIFIILILLIPLFFQIKYGVSALSDWIDLKFWQLTLLCVGSEFLLSFILTPFAGFGLFGIPIALLVLFVALIQKTAIK